MATKHDPQATYYARTRIRRTANSVIGAPKNAPGDVYIDPAELDDKGVPVSGSVLFTMSDRTPEQIEMLVRRGAIAPVPSSSGSGGSSKKS